MDITNWPIDKIMQLPDHCFGRRWPVAVYSNQLDIGLDYDISEAGLGNKCVVWQVAYYGGGAYTSVAAIALALGDVLPADDGQFDAFEPLLSDVGRRGADRRAVDLGQFGLGVVVPMRLPLEAQGRRLVGRFTVAAAGVIPPSAIMVVSSLPTEVPEWLISGQGRGL